MPALFFFLLGGVIERFAWPNWITNYTAEAAGIAASVAVVWLVLEQRREQEAKHARELAELQAKRIRESLEAELAPIRNLLCWGIVEVMRHVLGEPTRSQTVQPVDYVTKNFARICHLLDVDQNNGHSLKFQNLTFPKNTRMVAPASMPLRYFIDAAERSRTAVEVFHGQLIEYRTLLTRLQQYAHTTDSEAARWEKLRRDRDSSFASHQALLKYQIQMGARNTDHWIDPGTVPSFAVANMVALAIFALDLVVELSVFTETPFVRPAGERMTGSGQTNDYWKGPMRLDDHGAPIMEEAQ